MEGEFPPTNVSTATDRLRGYAQVREKVEQRGPSRTISQLMVWEAGATAAFVAAFLLTVGEAPVEDEVYTAVWLMAFPLMVFVTLVAGAKDRCLDFGMGPWTRLSHASQGQNCPRCAEGVVLLPQVLSGPQALS